MLFNRWDYLGRIIYSTSFSSSKPWVPWEQAPPPCAPLHTRCLAQPLAGRIMKSTSSNWVFHARTALAPHWLLPHLILTRELWGDNLSASLFYKQGVGFGEVVWEPQKSHSSSVVKLNRGVPGSKSYAPHHCSTQRIVWMGRWMGGWVDRRTKGWMNGLIGRREHHRLKITCTEVSLCKGQIFKLERSMPERKN